MKVVIIGMGNMGSAIAHALINSSFIDKKDLLCIVRDKNKADKDNFNCITINDLPRTLSKSFIIFAVKPQNIENVLEEYKFLSNKENIFISVLAGTKIEIFKHYLGKKEMIIRSMPNIAASIGESMTTLYSSEILSNYLKENIERIFTSIGKYIWVNEEEDINISIAAFGSSPAYFLLFMENLTNIIHEKGFDYNQTKEGILQVLKGLVKLLEIDNNPEKIRKKITSPNGTTQAGIESLCQNNLTKIMEEAVETTIKRAIELANNKA